MTTIVRASSLRGYVALMRELGADSGEMLRRYRIAPEALQDEEALLSLRIVLLLLEASAAAARCPDFGLRLSQSQDISVLGPLAIAMQNASTVAEALDYASRYMFVQSPGLALTVHDSSPFARNCVELRIEIRLERQPVQRQTVDLCLADLHQILQMIGGKRYLLRAVTLPHATLAPLRVYQRFFGATVLAEQAHASLHVARSTLDASLQAVNSTLRQISVEYLSLNFEVPGQTLTTRVRQTLRHTLGTNLSNKAEIANLLSMHPRTLQRRLANEFTSFESIRDELRKESALRYLRETGIPLKQLAGVLGLSEQSALGRSCRRWFGMSPLRLRNHTLSKRAPSQRDGPSKRPPRR